MKRELRIILQSDERGVWSATIDNGGGDANYEYGICMGYSPGSAVQRLMNRMAEREIERRFQNDS